MSSIPNETSLWKKPATGDSTATSVEKMQRLDRLANLGMLSAGMAHEIKNGMVAIKTFVDLLLEKNPDAELTEVVGRELQRINVDRDADAADRRAEVRALHDGKNP